MILPLRKVGLPPYPPRFVCEADVILHPRFPHAEQDRLPTRRSAGDQHRRELHAEMILKRLVQRGDRSQAFPNLENGLGVRKILRLGQFGLQCLERLPELSVHDIANFSLLRVPGGPQGSQCFGRFRGQFREGGGFEHGFQGISGHLHDGFSQVLHRRTLPAVGGGQLEIPSARGFAKLLVHRALGLSRQVIDLGATGIEVSLHSKF